MLSVAEENYIKVIYHLQPPEGAVSTNEIAAKMQTKAASVTDMLKKLDEKQLLHYEKYYGCSLTANGKKLALDIIRRHRLWECFLVDKLHFSWDEVHEIAEQLEHVQSAKLTDALDAYLGYPETDPHGDPIPNKKGQMEESQLIPLSEVPPDQPYKYSGIKMQTKEIFELLKSNHIAPGATLTMLRTFPFDGTSEIRVNGKRKRIISKQLSENILVKRITPCNP